MWGGAGREHIKLRKEYLLAIANWPSQVYTLDVLVPIIGPICSPFAIYLFPSNKVAPSKQEETNLF